MNAKLLMLAFMAVGKLLVTVQAPTSSGTKGIEGRIRS